jgi:glutaminyl-tRNA synthetase
LGYFCVDTDSSANQLIFNRTVALKDSWEEKGKQDENLINNSLKELNRYFKLTEESEQTALLAQLKVRLGQIKNFSLLQQAVKKNINNNKVSLLFVLLLYTGNDSLRYADMDVETLEKFEGLVARSDVRLQAILEQLKS